ncbi:piggyBac transposable element-derived protein 4-like [Schistocerca cancellata]|uniref:piggyBac transposable element-derived protein 4-like n=1 Tax=Schistocerca cancellata TaxID=274614 RepID=UPI002117D4B6|nr:piggyBac transposable element-derived protein 4-like [Schistocerca cancellata]
MATIPSNDDSSASESVSLSMPRRLRSPLAKATTSVTVNSSHIQQNIPNHSGTSGGSESVPIVQDDLPQWSQNFRVEALPNFVKKIGPAAVSTEMSYPSPHKIFCEFFTDEMVKHITFHTNLYATQKGKPFIPTTEDEIRVFLGINLFMSVKKLPSYRDYWSSSPDLNEAYICDLMTVKRFSFLLSHIHSNDNSMMPKRGQANFDKLFKIRSLVEMLNKRFAQCYQPHQKVAINESMVKFKGRSSMKQYMRDKPVKRGYKIWMLCDDLAYNLKFQVYTGRLATEKSELGLGAQVVSDLCEEHYGKNHIVFMDNFFTSYNLFVLLKAQKTSAVGTVNPARKLLPKLKEDKKMKRGDFDSKVSNHGVAFYKWMDKRAVNLIPTMHDPSDTTSVNRKENDGSTTVVACPRVLSDYNRSMNFVDNFDRLKRRLWL